MLVVDDDPFMHRMLVPRLEALEEGPPIGKVLTALTPTHALEQLEAAGAGPLVVLSDFNLKAAMNGVQLLAIVRDRRPDALRILISGYSQEQIGDVGEGGEAHAFLEKPMRIDDLMGPFAKLVERHFRSA